MGPEHFTNTFAGPDGDNSKIAACRIKKARLRGLFFTVAWCS